MLAQFGESSPLSLHMSPTPGKATEEDLLAFQARSGRICELIDGVLVEKIMGAPEALLAGFILHLFWQHLEVHDLGIVLAPDGLLRILGRQIRVPDVSFIRWERLANRQVPRTGFPRSAGPGDRDFSPGNTKGRVAQAPRLLYRGRATVWYIDPARGQPGRIPRRTGVAESEPPRACYLPQRCCRGLRVAAGKIVCKVGSRGRELLRQTEKSKIVLTPSVTVALSAEGFSDVGVYSQPASGPLITNHRERPKVIPCGQSCRALPEIHPRSGLCTLCVLLRPVSFQSVAAESKAAGRHRIPP